MILKRETIDGFAYYRSLFLESNHYFYFIYVLFLMRVTYPLAPFLKEVGTVMGGCIGHAMLPEGRSPVNYGVFKLPAGRRPAFLPLSFGREGRGERSPKDGETREGRREKRSLPVVFIPPCPRHEKRPHKAGHLSRLPAYGFPLYADG